MVSGSYSKIWCWSVVQVTKKMQEMRENQALFFVVQLSATSHVGMVPSKRQAEALYSALQSIYFWGQLQGR